MPANPEDHIVDLASFDLIEFELRTKHSIRATGELVEGSRAAIAESHSLMRRIDLEFPKLISEQEQASE